MSSIRLSIDFDSAMTSIYMAGSGLVLSEPTVAAVEADGKNVIKACGFDAKKLIGKTSSNTKIVFPVFEGEIVNEKVAGELLCSFLRKIGIKSRLVSVNAVMSVPCGATPDMIKKYEDVARSAGINKVSFVEAPILSALGFRAPLSDSRPCFIIDMAGGTTNIAAVTLDGIIAGVSVNFGFNKVSTDIIDYVAEVYGLQIGLLTAERLKTEIGSLAEDDGLSAVINGRDVKTGTPKALSIKALDLIPPVKKYYDKIADIARAVLVKLPPEVSADIRKSGIYLGGIGASIYSLDKYYGKKFDMLINVAEHKTVAVALGGGTVLTNSELAKKVTIKTL